jgi:hypothetical protein
VILLQVLFALEANNLRRWTLERRGHRFAGVAEGRNLEDAEIRHFSDLDAGESVVAAPPAPTTPQTPPAPTTTIPPPPSPPTPGVLYRPDALRPSAEAGDVVGLFPAPATPGGRSS